MNKSAFTVLRVGLAITFLLIGVLILKSPEGWGSLLLPWAEKLVPLSLKQAMMATAFLDIIIGFMLLIGTWVWIFSCIGAIHLVVILVTAGINDITVRDIGLLAAITALAIESAPMFACTKLFFREK